MDMHLLRPYIILVGLRELPTNKTMKLEERKIVLTVLQLGEMNKTWEFITTVHKIW